MRFLPKNAAHLVQPCDSFSKQVMKTWWVSRWEAQKMKSFRMESGRKPMKKFRILGNDFLQCAAAAIRDINSQRDEDGLP